MEFNNNFVPLKMWFETASRYMVDPDLKIHLICSRGKQEPSDYLFDVRINYDPETDAGHLMHEIRPDEIGIGFKSGDLGKLIISQSKQMKNISKVDIDCSDAFQKKNSDVFVVKCIWDMQRFKRKVELLQQENIPVVSLDAEAFLIHVLHTMTDIETWDEELKRCATNPFFDVPPTKLTFVIKKSFADCITAITGQIFQSIGNDEVVFLQREGRL
jgi:hypothetical protein